MANAQPVLIHHSYPGPPSPALLDVSTRIDPGMTVVAGPSGSGKSTLLRVFNGLVPHFHGGRVSGAATVAGRDVLATPTRVLARSAGFVFQDPELQTVYATVDREVAFGLENAAIPQGEMAGRVSEALHEVGIEHLAGRAVRTLSGGERQRVALASALAVRPRLVVLDEPTSQLDPHGAELLLAAARRRCRGRSRGRRAASPTCLKIPSPSCTGRRCAPRSSSRSTARVDRTGKGRRESSPCSVSRSLRTVTRETCRAASVSARPSRQCCPARRSSCFSTSRPGAWTWRHAVRSSQSLRTCATEGRRS